MLPDSIINDSPPEQRHKARQVARMVRQWNAAWPAGTDVKFWNLHGDPPVLATTRSEAWVSDGGQPVVLLHGKAGPVSLYHVLPQALDPGTLLAKAPGPDVWLKPDLPVVAEAACEVEAPPEAPT